MYFFLKIANTALFIVDTVVLTANQGKLEMKHPIFTR